MSIWIKVVIVRLSNFVFTVIWNKPIVIIGTKVRDSCQIFDNFNHLKTSTTMEDYKIVTQQNKPFEHSEIDQKITLTYESVVEQVETMQEVKSIARMNVTEKFESVLESIGRKRDRPSKRRRVAVDSDPSVKVEDNIGIEEERVEQFSQLNSFSELIFVKVEYDERNGHAASDQLPVVKIDEGNNSDKRPQSETEDDRPAELEHIMATELAEQKRIWARRKCGRDKKKTKNEESRIQIAKKRSEKAAAKLKMETERVEQISQQNGFSVLSSLKLDDDDRMANEREAAALLALHNDLLEAQFTIVEIDEGKSVQPARKWKTRLRQKGREKVIERIKAVQAQLSSDEVQEFKRERVQDCKGTKGNKSERKKTIPEGKLKKITLKQKRLERRATETEEQKAKRLDQEKRQKIAREKKIAAETEQETAARLLRERTNILKRQLKRRLNEIKQLEAWKKKMQYQLKKLKRSETEEHKLERLQSQKKNRRTIKRVTTIVERLKAEMCKLLEQEQKDLEQKDLDQKDQGQKDQKQKGQEQKDQEAFTENQSSSEVHEQDATKIVFLKYEGISIESPSEMSTSTTSTKKETEIDAVCHLLYSICRNQPSQHPQHHRRLQISDNLSTSGSFHHILAAVHWHKLNRRADDRRI